MEKISSGDLSFRLLPALNISFANCSILIPAISASAPAAILSDNVQVGERNISVSEIIAAQRSPAILGEISSFCSPYISYRIVAVHPTG